MKARVLVVLLALTSPLASCGGDPASSSGAEATAGATATASRAAETPPLEGFVVWESRRSGAWRIWWRDLAGGAPRKLSPDEPGRQHCCPHVAPDGRRLVFLSLPDGQQLYPRSGASGPLHLLSLDDDHRVLTDEVIAPAARTYFEHRAAVWRDDDELIHIDGEGRTVLRDLEGGVRVLVEEGPPGHGWLVNRTLTHATHGRPSFSVYDAERRRVIAEPSPGGCQPYFSFDGRWGLWVAGAGGPLRRIDLATRQTATVMAKSDPRLPAERGYLYFPNLSHDGRLLTFAASDGEHDQEKANYDVFVVLVDAETLEVAGEPLQITTDAGSDRYPDVFSPPLPLGRHAGEAPFSVELAAPGGAGWSWRLGDGAAASGATVTHRYGRPGHYRVTASTAGGETLEGTVDVRPARPPRIVAVESRRGRQIIVRFDEEVDIGGLRAELASGRAVIEQALDERRRNLTLTLENPLDGADEVLLAGIRDLAQAPNALPPTRLRVAAPRWPARSDGLALLWTDALAANEVVDPVSGEPRPSVFEPSGRAWTDRDGRMVLRGGTFVAEPATMQGALAAAQARNELTVELTVTPHPDGSSTEGPVLAFGSGPGRRNFLLTQEHGRLVFRLWTVRLPAGEKRPALDLGPAAGRASRHIAVTYTPGRLVGYVDGRPVAESGEVRGGLARWRPRSFQVGGEGNVAARWSGEVAGLAVYDRALDAAEVAENAQRFARERAARPAVASLRLRAELERRSPTPSLTEIAPYRDALAVYRYRVLEVLEGELDGRRVDVVQRVLLDGDETPVAQRRVGETYDLVVEPFAANPQLEGLFLAGGDEAAGELLYEPEIAAGPRR